MIGSAKLSLVPRVSLYWPQLLGTVGELTPSVANTDPLLVGAVRWADLSYSLFICAVTLFFPAATQFSLVQVRLSVVGTRPLD